jgi:hypothetical protein
VNAVSPSLDAMSLEIFEVLVRGSGEVLRTHVTNTPLSDKEKHKLSTEASQAEVLDIDDFDDSRRSDHASAAPAEPHALPNDNEVPRPRGRPVGTKYAPVHVIHVNTDDESTSEPDSGSRRPARAVAPIKRYAPVQIINSNSKKSRVLLHHDECFLCNDGGELVMCDMCPHVYHLDCVGLDSMPKGTWRCPWHCCSECDKSSSKAEGVLFHCMTCPLTYCFECAPDVYTTVTAQWGALAALKVDSLQKRGMTCPKSYRFFICSDCVADEREIMIPKPKPTPNPSKKKESLQPALPAALAIKAKQSAAKPYILSSRPAQVSRIINSSSSAFTYSL